MLSYKLNNDLIGLKIHNDKYDLPTRNLIICISNGYMTKNIFSLYSTYIPYIIHQLSKTIDYKEMYIIRNYPTISSICINKSNIYKKFNSLRRCNMLCNVDDIITMCCNKIHEIRNDGNKYPIDVMVITEQICDINNLMEISSSIFYIYDTINYNLSIQMINGKASEYYCIKKHDEFVNEILQIVNMIRKNIGIKDIRIQLCIDAEYCINDKSKIIEKYNDIIIDTSLNEIYLIVNKGTIRSSMINDESIELSINDINDINDINEMTNFYHILLNIPIDFLLNRRDLLDYILNLKSILARYYHENNGTELGYIILLLIKEYRYFFKNYVNSFSQINKMDNTGDFLKLINRFVNMIGFNINNSRLSQKTGQTILNNIKEIRKINSGYFINDKDKLDKLDNSRDFFTSMITMTDWYDELLIENTMGLLIHLEHEKKNPYINPKIRNITTTFLSVKDYIEFILSSFENQRGKNFNNIDIIKGDAIGSGNAIIPLYICDKHWKLARYHLEYVLGIILNTNPFAFTCNHLNFLFFTLSEMTKEIFKIELSDKWLKTYCSLYRTCIEIAYERKYHKGIKKIIKNYVDNREWILNTTEYDNCTLLGQILSTGCFTNINILSRYCDRIYENIQWRYINRHHVQTIIIDDNEIFNSKIVEITKFIDDKINPLLENIIFNYKMILILRNIFTSIGGFKKFINILDNNYGLPNNDIVILFKNNIVKNTNTINSKYLYTTINMDDNYTFRMMEYILRSSIYTTIKQRRESFINDPELWHNIENNINDVVNKYKLKIK